MFPKVNINGKQGRKRILKSNNIVSSLFMLWALILFFNNGYEGFAYFGLGLLVTRIWQIIVEMKNNIFDKPFLHYLLLIGIPIQYLWDKYF